MRKRRYEYFYERNRLKAVTGFVSKEVKAHLQRLAKEADKSLVRFISRLLEQYVRDSKRKEEGDPTPRP